MMINKIIEINAKPACEQILGKLLNEMIAPSRAELGCRRYDLYQDVQNSGRFLLYESWESDQALEEHRQTAHMKNFKEKAASLIDSKAGYSV